jgi:addiction module HigA family antidote
MKLKNIHPGEVLREEFMLPLNLSQNKLGRSIGVSPRRINEIVLEKRAITADTDLRLAKFFGTTPGFWLNLQKDYDLEERRKEIIDVLRQIRPLSIAK